MTLNSKTPKVSVCVVTYNQEKYIRECLQSIVDQQTDFDFEVIVGDDCSTDNTAYIVQEFAERYPDIVRPLHQRRNVGPTQNYLQVHNLARAPYIAHLDGDDYCLPGKLATLAAFLDAHEDCRIVWHRMLIINERGQTAVGMPVTPISRFIPTNKLNAADLAKYYGITGCHSGSMYRTSARKIFARKEETLDYFFSLSFVLDGGYASYIEEPYGVYRFFAHENTLTRCKGSVITGMGTLDMMQSLIPTNPELRKYFAAQCILELMVRTYLRYPLKWEYFKTLLACRSIPSPKDIALIVKVFLANRNTTLRTAFNNARSAEVQV